MKLKQGDIITHKDGDRRKVLGICGEVIFLGDMTTAYAYVYTEKELLLMEKLKDLILVKKSKLFPSLSLILNNFKHLHKN